MSSRAGFMNRRAAAADHDSPLSQMGSSGSDGNAHIAWHAGTPAPGVPGTPWSIVPPRCCSPLRHGRHGTHRVSIVDSTGRLSLVCGVSQNSNSTPNPGAAAHAADDRADRRRAKSGRVRGAGCGKRRPVVRASTGMWTRQAEVVRPWQARLCHI